MNSVQNAERADRQSPTRWIATFYAFIPVLLCLIWMAVGDPEDIRNKSPIDLVPILEILIVLVALKRGMGADWLKGALSPVELGALILVVGAFVWGVMFAAPEPLAAIERLSMRGPHILAAIALCYILTTGPSRDSRMIVDAIVAQPLVYVPVLIFLYVAYIDDPRINWLGGPIGFWHVRMFGMVLACGLAALIGFRMVESRNLRDTALAAIALVVLFALLFWSGSRGPLLGLFAAYVFSTILFPRRFGRSWLVVVPACLAGAALSLLLVNPMHAYGIINTVSETAGAANPDSVTGGRVQLWTETWALILDQPLLGHGFDQFRYIYDGFLEDTVQPHSVVFELLFDFGFIGGLAASFLLLSFWWRALRRTMAEDLPWKHGALLVLNALCVMSLFDGVLYHPEPSMLVALSFAVLLARPVDVASAPAPGYIAPKSAQR